jgi:hypothetical protein
MHTGMGFDIGAANSCLPKRHLWSTLRLRIWITERRISFGSFWHRNLYHMQAEQAGFDKPGVWHSINRVDDDAGDHCRTTVVGFFKQK